MNLLPMKYFIEVANEKSISRAAKNLHLTQQAVSKHMTLLEEELGCTLFLRKPHFELTLAGELFLAYATRFEQLYHAMQKEFHDIARQDSGYLSIGISPTRSRFLMAPLLSAFQKQHPKISVRLAEAQNEDLVDLLLNHQVDLIIGNFADDSSLITVKPFYEEESVLLVPGNLLTAEEKEQLLHGNFQALASCRTLLCTQESYTRRLAETFLKKLNLFLQISVISTNIETLLEMCFNGSGCCFCVKEMAARMFAGRDHSHLLEIPIGKTNPVRIAYRNSLYTSKALLDFVAICEDFATAERK